MLVKCDGTSVCGVRIWIIYHHGMPANLYILTNKSSVSDGFKLKNGSNNS